MIEKKQELSSHKNSHHETSIIIKHYINKNTCDYYVMLQCTHSTADCLAPSCNLLEIIILQQRPIK